LATLPTPFLVLRVTDNTLVLAATDLTSISPARISRRKVDALTIARAVVKDFPVAHLRTVLLFDVRGASGSLAAAG
jgi:hypothetical protein